MVWRDHRCVKPDASLTRPVACTRIGMILCLELEPNHGPHEKLMALSAPFAGKTRQQAPAEWAGSNPMKARFIE